MEFDSYTLSLLLLRDDAPQLDPAAEDALQDEHMAYLADLHERGDLLVSGPVLGAPDRQLRGFGVYRCDAARAAELANQDPAVIAGRYHHEIHPWLTPAGLIAFTQGQLPRSMAEATG